MYLVLSHAVTRVKDDAMTRNIMIIRWVVVKAVVDHSFIFQLESQEIDEHRHASLMAHFLML